MADIKTDIFQFHRDEPSMKATSPVHTSKKTMNRREFISTTTAMAATISVVPRHVLGGAGYTPPSEKITVANIGCGTQGLRELPRLLENPDIQVVSVCDVNKFTTDYLDWSPNGLRDLIREALDDPEWGAKYKGIPGGRDIGLEFVETYYGKHTPSGKYKGCSSYEDYRELLDKEKDIDAVKIMTPDHHHAYCAITAMKKGAADYLQKPINMEEVILRLGRVAKIKSLAKNAGDLREAMGITEKNAGETIQTLELAVSELEHKLSDIKELLEGGNGDADSIVDSALRLLT